MKKKEKIILIIRFSGNKSNYFIVWNKMREKERERDREK